QIAPLAAQKVFFTSINYGQAYDLFTREPVELKRKNMVLVCGIAKPAPMLQYLEQLAQDIHTITYADHHYFVTKDLEEIKDAYNNWDKEHKLIITTEKDAARLHLHADVLRRWGITIAVLPIEISLLFNTGNDFDSIVLNYV